MVKVGANGNEKLEDVDSKPKRSKNRFDSNLKWFNPTLNSSDLEYLEAAGDKLVGLVLSLLDEIRDEERLSFKYDSGSGRWLALLFAGGDDDPNTGYALSVRGATAFDAAVTLAYFHLVRFKQVWDVEGASAVGRWG